MLRRKFNIFYNDGVEYGSVAFTGLTDTEIEEQIQREIDSNNKNPNPNYHISRENFKERVLL